MTSKKSSVNPALFTFKNALKSSVLAPIISLFSGLLLIVFLPCAICLFEKYTDISGNLVSGAGNYKYMIFAFPDAYGNILPIVLACAGVIVSVMLFNFITSKKTVNVYYSLGIKRETLFLSKYLAGALLITLAVVIPMTAVLITNIVACGVSTQLFSAYFYITLTLLTVTLVAFSVTSAVFAAVGTVFETVVFSGVLLFLPTIILFDLQTLMSEFVYGNSYGEFFTYANVGNLADISSTSLSENLSFLSPVLFANDSLALYSVMDKSGKFNAEMGSNAIITSSPDFTSTLLWLLAAAVITALGVVIFKKRKAEICGFIGMNKYLNTLVVFTLAFCVFCATMYASNTSTVINTLIGVALFSVVYVVAELIILRDTKKFKKGIVKLPVELAVCVAVVLVFANGFFGYSKRMPEFEEIKSAAVTLGGVAEEYGFLSEESWGTNLLNYSACGGLVEGFESENDIKTILGIHEKVAKNKSDKKSGHTVQIVYTLKNGKTFMRSFNNVSPECYDDLIQLENSDVYKQRLYDIFKGEIKYGPSNQTVGEKHLTELKRTVRDDDSSVEVISKYLNRAVVVNLEKDERKKLVDSIYTDLLNRSVEEKYFPDSTPEMYIRFMYSRDYSVDVYEDAETEPKKLEYYDNSIATLYEMSNYSSEITIAVTSDMVNTLKCVKELGIYNEMTAKPEYTSVELVSIENCRPNDYYYSQHGHGRNLFFKGSINSYETDDVYKMSDGTYLGGKIFDDKSIIENALNNAYTSYQTSPDGYVAAFYNTEHETFTIMYIPENKLDNSLKSSVN